MLKGGSKQVQHTLTLGNATEMRQDFDASPQKQKREISSE